MAQMSSILTKATSLMNVSILVIARDGGGLILWTKNFCRNLS